MGHDLNNETTTRPRATREQTIERKKFIYLYAQEHQPVTIRQLFYAATVNGVDGIEKNETGYGKIQRVALAMRKERDLPVSLGRRSQSVCLGNRYVLRFK